MNDIGPAAFQGATIFDGLVALSPLAATILQEGDPQERGYQRTRPSTKDFNPLWPYAGDSRRTATDAPLAPTACCTCAEPAPAPDRFSKHSSRRVTGHYHKHRVGCPECGFAIDVASAGTYPVVEHYQCAGSYAMVTSNMYLAYHFEWIRIEDEQPDGYAIHDTWNDRYVSELDSGTTFSIEHAIKFPTITAVRQYLAQVQSGTALARTKGQSRRDDLPTLVCTMCNAQTDKHDTHHRHVCNGQQFSKPGWIVAVPVYKEGSVGYLPKYNFSDTLFVLVET